MVCGNDRYVAYTAMNLPGQKDHVVAIDRLAPDYLSSTGEQIAILPDYFVEGVMLFKRKSTCDFSPSSS